MSCRLSSVDDPHHRAALYNRYEKKSILNRMADDDFALFARSSALSLDPRRT